MGEDEMVGWYHQLHGQFEQARGDGEGQGGLVGHSQWHHKQLDTTEELNNNPSNKTHSSSSTNKVPSPSAKCILLIISKN